MRSIYSKLFSRTIKVKGFISLLVPFFRLGDKDRTDLSRRSVPKPRRRSNAPPPPNAPQHQKNCLKPLLNLRKKVFYNILSYNKIYWKKNSNKIMFGLINVTRVSNKIWFAGIFIGKL